MVKVLVLLPWAIETLAGTLMTDGLSVVRLTTTATGRTRNGERNGSPSGIVHLGWAD